MKYKKYIVFAWDSYVKSLNDAIYSSHNSFNDALKVASLYPKRQVIDRDTWEEAEDPAEDLDHNPDNLTPEQVGVKDGWRLLSKDENSNIFAKDTFARVDGWVCFSWGTEFCGGCDTVTYRTKKPAGYFLK